MLAASACMFLFVGCASKNESVPSLKASTYDPDSAEEIQLYFYSYNENAQEKFDQDWGNLIRQKFPNIEPIYTHTGKGTSIHELITAGQPVDIIFDSIGFFYEDVVATGMNMDMSDYIKREKNRLKPVRADLGRCDETIVRRQNVRPAAHQQHDGHVLQSRSFQ
jgi:multiple sugar transport system substrate-binding protein